MTQRSNRVAAGLLLVVVLACGAGIGIGVERLWMNPAKPAAPLGDADRVARLLARFKKELTLDPAQSDKAGDVLRRGRAEISAILARQQPELRAARARTREELTALLSPEQRVRYGEMVKRYDERRAQQAAAAK